MTQTPSLERSSFPATAPTRQESRPRLGVRALLAFAIPMASLVAGATSSPPPVAQQTQVPATIDDFFVPGTQPGGLSTPLQPSGNCSGCHGNYNPDQEPYEQWAASMMGQAGRDPIFYATLAIANQDVNFGGEACLRCHAPGAWLDGRSTPTNGSALDPSLGDLDGVNCHFCHRMVDPVFTAENPVEDQSILASLSTPPLEDPHTGGFIIDPEDRRRGPFELQNFFFHQWRESPFHRESKMCATCHDVSNPLLELQPDGTWQLGPLGASHPTAQKNDMFPVERTYSEWRLSVYAQDEIETGGRFGGDKTAVATCQDCHMPDTNGTGCNPNLSPPVRPDLPQHGFAGANSWVIEAIRAQYPDSETGLSAASVTNALNRNRAMLAAAADLEAVVEGNDLRVRITNMIGHKLPTGYGEGRRMWVQVRYFDAADILIDEFGGYNQMTADLDVGSTTVYEIDHGIDTQMSAATGLPTGKSLHFLLNNTVEKDNRIPARGFRSLAYEAVGAQVVGASYAEEQYWSETLYAIPAGAVRSEVRLFHQTTTKEYAEFLRDENVTDTKGTEAYQLWEMFGKSRPVEMGLVDLTLAASGELAPRPLALGKQRINGERAEITYTGSTTALGAGGTISITGGSPNDVMVLFKSPGQGSIDRLEGGVMNIVRGSTREAVIFLDGNGEAQVSVTFDLADIGVATVFQAFFRDSADPAGLSMTGGLRFDVTP